MLETEYKSLLTFEEYRKIEDFYEWDYIAEQENNYYRDDDGIISKNRIMFRVRVKDGKSVVQVKHHKNSGSPLQICEEIEFPIDGVPEIINDGERYTGIKTAPLKRLGSSLTLRHSKMWDADTEICLDKTTYLSNTDYELEIEYTGDKIPEKLIGEMKYLGVEFKDNSVGKYSRFLAALKAAK